MDIVAKTIRADIRAGLGPSVIVIAAHPDDEVLGCVGAIARLTSEGVDVHIAFLLMESGRARGHRPRTWTNRDAVVEAAMILGCELQEFDDLPDNRLGTVPMLEIARRAEALTARSTPTTLLTHHSGDLNVDHRRLHDAVPATCRPQPGSSVHQMLFFEV